MKGSADRREWARGRGRRGRKKICSKIILTVFQRKHISVKVYEQTKKKKPKAFS